MSCAVSCCVCSASIVRTAPARSANAFSSSRTAGISLLFSSTATWPRTAPMPCARAATRCGAFPSLPFAPRTVLPSMAITSRPPARTALRPQPGTENPVEHVRADQGERPPEGGLLRRAAGRAQRGQDVRAGVGGPLPDRGERPRPRDHRSDPDGQQPGQRMTAAFPLPRVRDLGKEILEFWLMRESSRIDPGASGAPSPGLSGGGPPPRAAESAAQYPVRPGGP